MATLKPLGPDDPDLGALSPEQFEELIFLLAHAEDQGVVPVRAKDQGLDARLPSGSGRATTRGWQAKRYTDQINWNECLTSVRRARAFWRPPHVTFCFSKDLSAREQEDFRKRLVDAFPELRLDFWSGTELKRRMRASEDGERAARYFFGDPRAELEALKRVAAVGGELSSAQQALARLGVINDFLQHDPHFRYQVGFGEADGPPSTPATETTMSLDVDVEGTRVRVDASERYEGASREHGPRGVFIVENEAQGRAIQAELDRISRQGGSAKLEPGTRIRMERVPEALAEFLPDDMTMEAVEIGAGPQVPRKGQPLAVLVGAGSLEAATDLGPTEPPADWLAAVSGGFGGLEILLAIRPSPTDSQRGQAWMTWKHRMGVGTTMEQLAAIELVGAMYQGLALRITDVQSGQVLIDDARANEMSGPDLEAVDGRIELLRALAELEAWTGRQFHPPPAWDADDAQSLFAALGLIRRPLVDDAEGVRIKLTYKPAAMPEDLAGVHQFASTQSLAINLFGQEIDLGQRMIHLPRGRFAEVDEATRTAVVVPDDGHSGSSRLFPPGEATPFGARSGNEAQPEAS